MSETTKHVCIHGHFYQPPRENAWLGEVERQPSAAPFHDWNERISSECYYANAYSRILNDQDKITAITNNYSRMSFNFGPTLLQWLEREQPNVHDAIVQADRLSRHHFNGHGSAMAQVYNHIIMPLANRRDKLTQVRWGIEDFRYRFRRDPEGMWLAETAVDTESLEVMAAEGIRFTVLAPRQFKQMRKIGDTDWSSHLDTRRPYLCQLPSGKSIALFFYDGDRSQRIAFQGLLNDGRAFAHSLTDGFDDQPAFPQLVHVATDGESYGHHHRHGDMALAYCMHYIETQTDVSLTNYSQFLALYPPTHEAQIHDNSSWSCVHGVERWRSDCGCNTGGHQGWNQRWRKPLREALDQLRDELALIFEEEMAQYTRAPWELRDRYVEVLLDRSRLAGFLRRELGAKFEEEDIPRLAFLLEMQHHSLLMFTSCAWFFDEVSRIEASQILQYARRAIQLAGRVSKREIEEPFLSKLAEAKSNIPSEGDGAQVYKTRALPAQFDLTKVAMHFTASKLLEGAEDALQLNNYDCHFLTISRSAIAAQRLLWGEVWVRSKVTHSELQFYFVLIYLGDQHVFGRSFPKRQSLEHLQQAFEAGNLAKVMQIVQAIPEGQDFSFFNLRPDAQKQFLQAVVQQQVKDAYEMYDHIYMHSYNLLNLLHGMKQEIPPVLLSNLEWSLEHELESLLTPSDKPVNTEKLKKLVSRYQKWEIKPNKSHFEYLATKRLTRLLCRLTTNAKPGLVFQNIKYTLILLRQLDIFPALKHLQNTLYEWMVNKTYQEYTPETVIFLRELAEAVHFDAHTLLRRRS